MAFGVPLTSPREPITRLMELMSKMRWAQEMRAERGGGGRRRRMRRRRKRRFMSVNLMGQIVKY